MLIPGHWGREPDGSGRHSGAGRLPGGGQGALNRGVKGLWRQGTGVPRRRRGVWGGSGMRRVPKGMWTSGIVHLSLLWVRPAVKIPRFMNLVLRSFEEAPLSTQAHRATPSMHSSFRVQD